MKDFDKVNKDALKKKLEYKEYAIERQEEILGKTFSEMKKILKEMKEVADKKYLNKKFNDAIEEYMKSILIF